MDIFQVIRHAATYDSSFWGNVIYLVACLVRCYGIRLSERKRTGQRLAR